MGWPDTVVKRCGRAGECSVSISADEIAGFSSLSGAAFTRYSAHGYKLCSSRRTHASILGPAPRGAKHSAPRWVSQSRRPTVRQQRLARRKALAPERLADAFGGIAGCGRGQVREHIGRLPVVSVVALINKTVR